MSVARLSIFAGSVILAGWAAACSGSSTAPIGSAGASGSGNGAGQAGAGATGLGGASATGGQSGTAAGSGQGGSSGAGARGGASGSGGAGQAGTGASPSGGSSSGGASGGSSATGGGAAGQASGGQTSGGAAGSGGAQAGAGGAQGGAGGAQGGAGGASGGAATNPICAGGPFTGSPLSSSNAMATKAASAPLDGFNNNGNNYTTLEGALWLEGALYFSEIQSSGQPPRSRILKMSADGQVSQFYPKDTNGTSGTNGLAVDPTGKLIGTNHGTGAITQFDLAGGAPTDLVTMFMGARFNSPNDLVFKSDGTLYFTDPNAWQAPAQKPQSAPRVYRVAKGSNTAVAVLDPSKQPSPQQPNGVTFSLDEKTLFVSGPEGVYSYPVQADGSLGTGTRFNNPSRGDGMTLDCAGNLYVSSDSSIVVLDPSGKQIGTISVPSSGASALTNVAFGGADHKTLYMTAQGGSNQHNIFKLAVNIPGMPY